MIASTEQSNTARADDQFSASLTQAMKSVERILDRDARDSLRQAEDIHHSYSDKFALAETLCRVFISSWCAAADVGLGIGSNTATTNNSNNNANTNNTTTTNDKSNDNSPPATGDRSGGGGGGGNANPNESSASKENTFQEIISKMRAVALDNKAVTMSFKAKESCSYVREVTTEVANSTFKKKSIRKSFTEFFSVSTKKIETVTTHFWTFKVEWELKVYSGTGDMPGDVLWQLEGSPDQFTSVTTREKSAPFPEINYRPAFEVNINWLLEHTDKDCLPLFSIDRSDLKCFTPRRNEDISKCIAFCNDLIFFCKRVCEYFCNTLDKLHVLFKDAKALDPNYKGSYSDVSPLAEIIQQSMEIFVPVYASSNFLVEIDGSEEGSDDQTRVVDRALVDAFVSEQRRVLKNKIDEVVALLCRKDVYTVSTPIEGRLIVSCAHLNKIAASFEEGADHIESVIRKQLVAAIGRELSSADLSEYMKFHNKKLFKPQFVPVPFCYAVRRSNDHSPEGTVSIEETAASVGACNNRNISSPICTISDKRVMTNDRKTNIEFALDASTRISFGGERHLHAWLRHSFGDGEQDATVELVSEARQFSSFIVLIGRISSARSFEPKYAFIVKDKDSVRIPLNLEQIPSAKEFKEAVKSLSPEQQAFAKAFRGMQLESTLFGVCIIQVKPLLERVLNLSADTLTKEIRLSQDLIDLFIDYQIPSDLLSFGGSELVNPIEEVKGHVQKMQDMIKNIKSEEIAKKLQEETVRLEADLKAKADRYETDRRGNSYEGDDGNDYFVNEDDFCSEGGLDFEDFDNCGAACNDDDNDDVSDEDNRILPLVKFKEASSRAPMKEMQSRAHTSNSNSNDNYNNNNNNNNNNNSLSPTNPQVSAAKGKLSDKNENTSESTNEKTTSENANEDKISNENSSQGTAAALRDYTIVPSTLDRRLERTCKGDTIRATIVHPADEWLRGRQEKLSSPLRELPLLPLIQDDIEREKKKAFALLDALTKSGSLTVEEASLHVVVVASQCFEQSLVNTVVRRSANPIDGVERSTLAIAEVVHNVSMAEMVKPESLSRVLQFHPTLQLRDI